ncbi:MAG TPA: hypothetical protein VF336_01780, partial [Syntrophales bacterium]
MNLNELDRVEVLSLQESRIEITLTFRTGRALAATRRAACMGKLQPTGQGSKKTDANDDGHHNP